MTPDKVSNCTVLMDDTIGNAFSSGMSASLITCLYLSHIIADTGQDSTEKGSIVKLTAMPF